MHTHTFAISLDHIKLAYRKQTVLSDITLQIPPATLTAIVGGNGCGKSTLIKAIAAQIKPASGHLQIAFNSGQIAYLSQISEIDRSFPISVFDFVACGLWTQTGAFKAINRNQAAQIHTALKAVGMGAHADKLIGELSGGQFQRIRFAQIILQRPQLLLLDEPFTGIDEPTIADLMNLLHQWHQEGATLLVVLHDLELARQQFPQTILLGQNRVQAWGPTSDCLSTDNLLHPFAQNMPSRQPCAKECA